MLLHRLYFEMRDSWEAINLRQIAWAEKQAACLALLPDLVDKLAAECVGHPNPPLRFFADLDSLSRLLFGRSDSEIDDIATLHARQIVKNWLHANAFGNATKSIGGAVDVDHHLNYMQLRAIQFGNRPGWPPLDPMRMNSEYVQAILGRTIEPEKYVT